MRVATVAVKKSYHFVFVQQSYFNCSCLFKQLNGTIVGIPLSMKKSTIRRLDKAITRFYIAGDEDTLAYMQRNHSVCCHSHAISVAVIRVLSL